MRNKVLFLLTLVFMLSLSTYAQRGVRIAYIDTEYILENVPEYQEATTQLNDKAQKWKIEIDQKLAVIEQKRKDLSNEKALLTKELIDEREEDIDFEEQEILDYQQKRFGPNGDLFIQQKQLMQPLQDQIFSAVQDLAEGRKYDLVLDKSETNLLYSNKAYDVSEQILRSITRASKRTQAQSKAERKTAEEEELIPEINEELESRQKALEEKKAERESAIEKARQEKLDARAAKVKAAEEKRQKILDDRKKAKQDKLGAENSTNEEVKNEGESTKSEETKAEGETKTKEQLIEENRQKKLAEREARKKALEDKKKKIIEDRQKAKDSTNNN
ncbi:chaperone for outer membrane proteins, Skp family [Flaviramulus basaltis]|uniref:Chaperone for outer membrane proteins, Skp family n=1 Tax=Flaviramulus basaltis TaxID=369401 RepID=A0A1K2IEL8_9FLAO|nr:OmpH family outer membrane protein [Flaviramulus basaltis]SFZ90831.1 chaperone for outer membrane proteins, Skp family [Flaviramulus basaltis]